MRGILAALWEFASKQWRKSPDQIEPDRSILVIGAGGTGKTTFSRLLEGHLDWLDDPPGEYVESMGVDRLLLTDDSGLEVVVAPGQAHRRESTWPELLADLTKGIYRGVVLVNAFGYHTFSVPSMKNHMLWDGSRARFLPKYLESRRMEGGSHPEANGGGDGEVLGTIVVDESCDQAGSVVEAAR